MNLNLSERDKQVLYVLMAALIILAAWYFGCRNFNNKAEEYRNETKQLEIRYNELLEKSKNKAQYLADTSVYNEESTKILSEYTDGHSLENTVKYIYELEDNTSIFIDNFSITDGTVAYSFADGTKQGIKIPITFSYEASYDNLKSVIDYINTFASKCSIDSLSIMYDAAGDVATGTVTMNTYAVITPDSTEPEFELDMPVGNDNIFISTSTYQSTNVAQTGDYIIDDYDLLLELVQPQANMASVSLGLADSDDAPLTSNTNGKTEVEIVFSGVDGNYTVAYKVGDTSYPARNYQDGVSFEPGDTIDVLVSSTEAAGANDNVAVDVSIINNTDRMVYFKVINDETSERFNVASQEGRVRIYR